MSSTPKVSVTVPALEKVALFRGQTVETYHLASLTIKKGAGRRRRLISKGSHASNRLC